jgi:hypothetical protein
MSGCRSVVNRIGSASGKAGSATACHVPSSGAARRGLTGPTSRGRNAGTDAELGGSGSRRGDAISTSWIERGRSSPWESRFQRSPQSATTSSNSVTASEPIRARSPSATSGANQGTDRRAMATRKPKDARAISTHAAVRLHRQAPLTPASRFGRREPRFGAIQLSFAEPVPP